MTGHGVRLPNLPVVRTGTSAVAMRRRSRRGPLTPARCGRSVEDVVLLVSRRHVDLGRTASAL